MRSPASRRSAAPARAWRARAATDRHPGQHRLREVERHHQIEPALLPSLARPPACGRASASASRPSAAIIIAARTPCAAPTRRGMRSISGSLPSVRAAPPRARDHVGQHPTGTASSSQSVRVAMRIRAASQAGQAKEDLERQQRERGQQELGKARRRGCRGRGCATFPDPRGCSGTARPAPACRWRDTACRRSWSRSARATWGSRCRAAAPRAGLPASLSPARMV